MLSDELQKILNLLQTYVKDLKFAKSSILTSKFAPQFPNSKWSNIIIGSMVDLDHVISGSFAISNDNREVEVIGGIQFKFGVAKASKHVKTSGDRFITWNQYSKAVSLLSHTGLVSCPCTRSRFLGFFLPPILEATQVSSTLTKQSGSMLANVETYYHAQFEDLWLEACQHCPTSPKLSHIPHTPNLPTPHLDTSWQQLYENICETSTANHEEEQVNQDSILWNDEKLTKNDLERQKTGHLACKACHNPPMANHKVVQSNSMSDKTSKWGPVASSVTADMCKYNHGTYALAIH